MTQTNITWLEIEDNNLQAAKKTFETLEPLKLEDGKLTKFIVEVTDKPFENYIVDGTTKKIIPVIHDGKKKNLWLNVKNPLYSDLIKQLKEGKREFTVFTTGKGKETRYSLVQ